MAAPFRILGTDHIAFTVGNAKQAAHYYHSLYGFRVEAYRGLETGDRETTSYVLRQGRVRLVLTAPLVAESPLHERLRLHGDSVQDIAFQVDDARAAFDQTVMRGAEPVQEPKLLRDEFGEALVASIRTYGSTLHSFVERRQYRGAFLPGYETVGAPPPGGQVGLGAVDHVVGNQGAQGMEPIADWYAKVFGFHRMWTVDDKDISTQFSALRSIVVASEDESIRMPINEPAPGLKKSQIQEFVDYNNGPGVQHIAMATDDIIATIRRLRGNGVEFLAAPTSYYDDLTERVGKIDESVRDLADLGILVDRDDSGYLLQLFTRPVEDRPTLFLEVIQRKGARSFGKGNFKALFEAIEREQARRGNL